MNVSYAMAVILSAVLHLILAIILLSDLQFHTNPVVPQPEYIKARLVNSLSVAESSPSETLAKKVEGQQQEKYPLVEKQRIPLQQVSSKPKGEVKRSLEAQRTLESESQPQHTMQQPLDAEGDMVEAEFIETLMREQALRQLKEDDQIVNRYVLLIRQRLAENWNRPPNARRNMEALIELRLVPTGRIVGVELIMSSGDNLFDHSVEQAVFKVQQFEELQQLEPRIFERYFRSLKVSFKPEDLKL